MRAPAPAGLHAGRVQAEGVLGEGEQAGEPPAVPRAAGQCLGMQGLALVPAQLTDTSLQTSTAPALPKRLSGSRIHASLML